MMCTNVSKTYEHEIRSCGIDDLETHNLQDGQGGPALQARWAVRIEVILRNVEVER